MEARQGREGVVRGGGGHCSIDAKVHRGVPQWAAGELLGGGTCGVGDWGRMLGRRRWCGGELARLQWVFRAYY